MADDSTAPPATPAADSTAPATPAGPAAPGIPAFPLPAAVPHGPLRTFHPRRNALGRASAAALRDLWPALGLAVHEDGPAWGADGLLDRAALFGRTAPLVVEIGSGMGEAVTAMAAVDPERDYLAVEAHVAGIAHTLRLVHDGGLANVRVAHGDALELLRHRIAPASLDAVHVFFPDPWPKVRHHERRLIQPAHVALLRSRLVPGGTLHCATDWAPYAAAMLRVLTADPELLNPHDGFAPRPPHRPVTRFEQRGLELGHDVADLLVRRVGAAGPDG